MNKKAKIELLRNYFFPTKGILSMLWNNLPKEAIGVLEEEGYFQIEVDCGSFPSFQRDADEEIDDSAWNGLSDEAKKNLLENKLLPQKGIPYSTWERLNNDMQSLLSKHGYYCVDGI